MDKVSVETIIKQNRYDFKVIELDTGSNPNNYILFSNENNELQRQFNQAVKKLYSDGTLKKLRKISWRRLYSRKEGNEVGLS